MKTPILLKNKGCLIDGDALTCVWYPTYDDSGNYVYYRMDLDFLTEHGVLQQKLYYASIELAMEDYNQLINIFIKDGD